MHLPLHASPGLACPSLAAQQCSVSTVRLGVAGCIALPLQPTSGSAPPCPAHAPTPLPTPGPPSAGDSTFHRSSLQSVARDAKQLLEQLGVQRVAVIGTSGKGGWVVQGWVGGRCAAGLHNALLRGIFGAAGPLSCHGFGLVGALQWGCRHTALQLADPALLSRHRCALLPPYTGGGPYAAAFAQLYPEATDSLTLVCPLGPSDRRNKQLRATLQGARGAGLGRGYGGMQRC